MHRITRVLIIGVAGLSLSGTTVVQVREEERRRNIGKTRMREERERGGREKDGKRKGGRREIDSTCIN